MNKLYDRIDWHNNTTPAINETNLNRMSKAVDDIDDRVVDIAATVMETVPQIQEDLAEAQELVEDAEELTTHPPIIGQNGNWWVWDINTDAYVDSGVDAGVSLTIGTTSTLTPGSDATVTNSGTATDPILNFGIPAGVAGQNGQDGVSPAVAIGTIPGGHSVTITDADHPSGQTFDVMDGTNGGHTILNSSGTSMTQRTGLQFDGLNVTDDLSNDKTIVTGTPQSMIGDAWVNNHAYAVGDYCIDGNTLYKCKTAHTSSASYRPPYASYWDAVTVSSQLQIEYGGGGVNKEIIADTTLQTLTADSYHRLSYSYSKNTGLTKAQFKERYSQFIVMISTTTTSGTSEYGVGSHIVDVDTFMDYPNTNGFFGGDNIWSLTESDSNFGRPFSAQVGVLDNSISILLMNYQKAQTSLKMRVVLVGILR